MLLPPSILTRPQLRVRTHIHEYEYQPVSGLPESRTRVTHTGVAFTFTNTSPSLLANSSPSLFSTIRINVKVEAPEEWFVIVYYTDSNLPLLWVVLFRLLHFLLCNTLRWRTRWRNCCNALGCRDARIWIPLLISDSYPYQLKTIHIRIHCSLWWTFGIITPWVQKSWHFWLQLQHCLIDFNSFWHRYTQISVFLCKHCV